MTEQEDGRIPIEDVLTGASIRPLQEKDVFISAYVLIKHFDENGDPTWTTRTTETPNDEELYGALLLQAELIKRSMLADWDVESG